MLLTMVFMEDVLQESYYLYVQIVFKSHHSDDLRPLIGDHELLH